MDDRTEKKFVTKDQVDQLAVAVDRHFTVPSLPSTSPPPAVIYCIAGVVQDAVAMYPSLKKTHPDFVELQFGGVVVNVGMTSNTVEERYSGVVQRLIDDGALQAHVLCHPTRTRIAFHSWAAELQQTPLFYNAMDKVLQEFPLWKYYNIGKKEAHGYIYFGEGEATKEMSDEFVAAVFKILTPAVKAKTGFVDC